MWTLIKHQTISTVPDDHAKAESDVQHIIWSVLTTIRRKIFAVPEHANLADIIHTE